VEYRVRLYKQGREDDKVRSLVEKKKKQYPIPGQIIVYYKEIAQAKRVAKAVGCSVYYHNMGTDAKKRILQQLTNGQEQVFAATNALGLGIDAQSIRVVVHVGISKKMRNYVQESGRAGRDGLKSEAIIMRAW